MRRAKGFGLNAARVYGINAAEVKKHTRADRIAEERIAYSERPEPHYLTYGPKIAARISEPAALERRAAA
jgi:uncharacterized protein